MESSFPTIFERELAGEVPNAMASLCGPQGCAAGDSPGRDLGPVAAGDSP